PSSAWVGKGHPEPWNTCSTHFLSFKFVILTGFGVPAKPGFGSVGRRTCFSVGRLLLAAFIRSGMPFAVNCGDRHSCPSCPASVERRASSPVLASTDFLCDLCSLSRRPLRFKLS